MTLVVPLIISENTTTKKQGYPITKYVMDYRGTFNLIAIYLIVYQIQTQIWGWPYCLLFWSPDCMDLLHFQTCKTWILPFGEVQQYAHPWDEGKNVCLLCQIDVCIIARHVFGGGGGGWFNWRWTKQQL